jgi:hypothetical protein
MAAATVIPIQAPRGSLYEITDHLAALFDTIEMVETPEDRLAIEAEIDRYLAAEIRKVDSVAGYLAHCETQSDFAAAEIKRLQERKALYERRFDRVKQYVIGVMEFQGLKKIEGQTSTLALRGCPASVDVLDEAAVPEEFKIAKTVVSVDKKALKAALEAGRDVAGADLVFGKNTLVRR